MEGSRSTHVTVDQALNIDEEFVLVLAATTALLAGARVGSSVRQLQSPIICDYSGFIL